MVHVDGDVTVCCLDEHMENRLGNLRETPLSQLWNGETINAWRAAHLEGRFQDSGPLCTRCNWQSAGSATDDSVQRWLSRHGTPELERRWRQRMKRA